MKHLVYRIYCENFSGIEGILKELWRFKKGGGVGKAG